MTLFNRKGPQGRGRKRKEKRRSRFFANFVSCLSGLCGLFYLKIGRFAMISVNYFLNLR